MSLSTNISVLQGATGVTLTGGSAVTFANDGAGVDGRKSLIDTTNTNPTTRKRLLTNIVIGAISLVSGQLAKLHRNSVVMHQPYVDAAGVKYDLPDQFNMSYHPSQTAAERETKFWNFISVIVDSELANLRNMINE